MMLVLVMVVVEVTPEIMAIYIFNIMDSNNTEYIVST